ncbi:MAG: DUF882 domain-containing protein [Myxococcales bacterium]|nr:MAG: DUF882 domain-containing protein [Myxococcales bacterium]
MNHWLSVRTRSLTAAAALFLSLGLSASAHAESATDATRSPKAHHGKPRRTAQVAKADADKKAHGKASDKKAEHADKADKADKADGKTAKAHGSKVTKATGRHGKTAQAHPTSAGRHAADGKAAAADKADEHDQETCVRNAVEIQRTSGEQMSFPLTRCHGKPADKSLERLSVLMRPYSVSKPGELPDLHPAAGAKGLREGEIAPGVHTADAGLLSRLQAIASEYPGKAVTVVSGYRPGGNGAYHRHGKALDVRVEGVSNESLATFCRGLGDTGCGYYPNGEFVHIDVRPKGSGHVYWIDSAGPGEAPHYVASWPPAKGDEEKTSKPGAQAPHDDTQHADVKKKAGRGAARADRDSED